MNNIICEKGDRMRIDRIKIALVGCGSHASSILHTALGFLEDVEIVAVCDLDMERAIFAQKRFGLNQHYTDVDQMLSETSAEAALVVSPPHIQASLIKKCLLNNLNVYVEKPLAIDLEEAYELKELAEVNNLILTVGFNKRFSQYYNKVYEAIKSEKFEKPSMIYMKFAGGYRPKTWDLLTVGSIHMFDIAKHFIGEIDEIYANMHKIEEGKANISVSLKFKSGAVGVFVLGSTGFWSVKGGEYIEIIGDRNCISLDNATKFYWQKPTPIDKDGGSSHQALKEIPSSAEVMEPNYMNVSNIEMHSFVMNGYYGALKNFVQNIRDQKQTSPCADDAIYALKTALAIQKSIEIGQSVKISEMHR
ncbi:Gfo/Idh/MocA family oxidoreductase [Alkalihalobacillus oceani]|uniref:Gfo/Idh/MocA family protein n=1 Tax=Halalkalibacter oceani TaxID=1653776 RepID=UPI00203CFB8B|nr:Gfo/Idh/MocA family oxidoreductase [Halalkalibacter oceani]MCM3763235.1 Gfo/Idh/MocA family oxidoreductase [Halalkalibacter oceani]